MKSSSKIYGLADLKLLPEALSQSGFLIWFIAAIIISFFSFELGLGESLIKVLIPLCVVSLIALLHSKYHIKY